MLSDGNCPVCAARGDRARLQNAGVAMWTDGTSGAVGEIADLRAFVAARAGDAVCSGGASAGAGGGHAINSPDYTEENGPAAIARAVAVRRAAAADALPG